MKVNKQKLFPLTVLAPVLAVLTLYGYIGTYNRLLGDSLCSYYYAERLGLLRSIWYWRITWSGRYSAYSFDWLLSKFFPQQFIPWFIPIALLVWVSVSFLVVYFFLRSKTPENQNALLAAALGTVAVFFTLTIMPSIEQSFFWVDGFRAYTLPLILLTLYGLMYQSFGNRIKSRSQIAFASLISFILFLFSGGLSETFAVIQSVLLFFLIPYSWLTEKKPLINKDFFVYFFGLLGAIAGMVIVITAPGNVVRQSFFPPPPDLFKLMNISINGYLAFLTRLMSPNDLMTLISSVMFSVWAGSNYRDAFQFHGRKILFLIAGAFLISFSCFPPGVYGYSEPPPDRVLSIAVFVTGIMLMSAGFIAGSFLHGKFLGRTSIKNIFITISIILLYTSSWMNFTSLYAARDTYIEYAKVWDETDAIIRQAKSDGEESVSVIPNASWAGMDLLNSNPKHWVNECYSFYYGIQVFGSQ